MTADGEVTFLLGKRSGVRRLVKTFTVGVAEEYESAAVIPGMW